MMEFAGRNLQYARRVLLENFNRSVPRPGIDHYDFERKIRRLPINRFQTAADVRFLVLRQNDDARQHRVRSPLVSQSKPPPPASPIRVPRFHKPESLPGVGPSAARAANCTNPRIHLRPRATAPSPSRVAPWTHLPIHAGRPHPDIAPSKSAVTDSPASPRSIPRCDVRSTLLRSPNSTPDS